MDKLDDEALHDQLCDELADLEEQNACEHQRVGKHYITILQAKVGDRDDEFQRHVMDDTLGESTDPLMVELNGIAVQFRSEIKEVGDRFAALMKPIRTVVIAMRYKGMTADTALHELGRVSA